MAELARLGVLAAVLARVPVFAGEALVQVQALVPFGAPLEHVELADLHHLGREKRESSDFKLLSRV